MRRTGAGADADGPVPANGLGADQPAGWTAWLVALASFTIAYLGTDLTWPLLRPSVFLLFFGAVAFTAWYGGRGPAALVIALSVVSVAFRFHEPFGRPTVSEPAAWVRLAGFVVIAGIIVATSTQLREHRHSIARALREVRDLNAQLRERTEAAEAANRAKTDFLTVMSHELRTPLNAIIGYAELLSNEVSGSLTPSQHEYVAYTNRAAWHLLDLVEQILSLSRIEANQEPVDDREVDVSDVVTECMELIRPLAERKGLATSLSVPDRPVVIRTDPGKVRQIALNLCGNAVKFTAQGTIGAELTDGPGGIELRIRDTGIGIAEADLERIFEPFVQVDAAATTRLHGGTGLGLPVSRRLAQLLGGDLRVESTPGTGSTFILRLPQRA